MAKRGSKTDGLGSTVNSGSQQTQPLDVQSLMRLLDQQEKRILQLEQALKQGKITQKQADEETSNVWGFLEGLVGTAASVLPGLIPLLL